MTGRRALLPFVLVVLTAFGPALLSPTEAVTAAADAAPRGVRGVFAMRVTATGWVRGRVYLNSENDYRDQRNLTINITPRAAERLARRHGERADRFFVGKRIEVRGTARRTRIDFISRNRPTGLYYYQTHVAVTDPDQISIVD
jgi:hypothetical protein